jgi:hypothetical protein
MNSFISFLPVLIALVTGILVSILIIVKCERTYFLVKKDRNVYIFKAAIALAVWGTLSLFLLIFISGYLMGMTHLQHQHATVELSQVLPYLGLELMYALVGWLLIHWMKRREDT